jgi:hypothetical protein
MSIHGYIWLYIENEEVTVEEKEPTLSTEIHRPGTIFTLTSVEQSPTLLQHKASPGAFATSLLF